MLSELLAFADDIVSEGNPERHGETDRSCVAATPNKSENLDSSFVGLSSLFSPSSGEKSRHVDTVGVLGDGRTCARLDYGSADDEDVGY